jgi:hypothetical protein
MRSNLMSKEGERVKGEQGDASGSGESDASRTSRDFLHRVFQLLTAFFGCISAGLGVWLIVANGERSDLVDARATSEEQQQALRADNEDLATTLEDTRRELEVEAARDRIAELEQGVSDSEDAADTPIAGDPSVRPEADALYLLNEEASRVDGDGSFYQCSSSDKINRVHYPSQACWELGAYSYSSTTEWMTDATYSRLRGMSGVLDSCPPDASFTLRILGEGRVLHSTTMAASSTPEELDVDITGVRRVAIEVVDTDGLGDPCPAIGELRIE